MSLYHYIYCTYCTFIATKQIILLIIIDVYYTKGRSEICSAWLQHGCSICCIILHLFYIIMLQNNMVIAINRKVLFYDGQLRWHDHCIDKMTVHLYIFNDLHTLKHLIYCTIILSMLIQYTKSIRAKPFWSL